jgi:prepilin-type N-terminal cleavage/methylation domain-containing protein
MSNKQGFTLVEVLIAVALLAMIGVFTGSAVFSTFKIKTATENDMETYDVGRAVLRVISRDVRLAFHRPKIKGEKTVANPFQDEDGQIRMESAFIGKDSNPYDELHFTTLSHRRYYKNSHESEHAEISYYVAEDTKSEKNMMVLYKRETGRVDDDITEGGRSYKIAEGITFLDFQYWDCKAEKFVDSWDSVEGIDYKGRFPDAVKVTVGLDDFNGAEKLFEVVAIIEMPNNIMRNNDLVTKGPGPLGSKCAVENGICEKDKGETYATCPTDCKDEKGKEPEVVKLLTKAPTGSCKQ